MADGSILNQTKRVLGLAEDYTVFDQDVIMHINSTFSTLHQLGVGPANGFAIQDASATWDQFLGGDPTINSVKSYVHICVRMLFDGNSLSPETLRMFKASKDELEWRLMVAKDPYDGTNLPDDDSPLVIDGGGA
jgi:hypothetical protein